MTDTIQTPADNATDEAREGVAAEEFLHLDPADIIIGTNVRTDLRPEPDRRNSRLTDEASSVKQQFRRSTGEFLHPTDEAVAPSRPYSFSTGA